MTRYLDSVEHALTVAAIHTPAGQPIIDFRTIHDNNCTRCKETSMERINARTVELTVEEEAIKALFDDYLSQGHGIPYSAKFALHRGIAEHGAHKVSDEFAAWLSDGTVERHGARFRVKVQDRW